MILAQYLPERSAQDILAGRVRLTFGGEVVDLPVLTISQNETWKERCASELGTLLAAFESVDSAPQLLVWLGTATDLQIRLLRAYDVSGVLPDDGWVRDHATPDALLRATLEVTAAAFPTFAVVLDAIVRNPALLAALTPSRSTSGPRPSTAGDPGSSGRD